LGHAAKTEHDCGRFDRDWERGRDVEAGGADYLSILGHDVGHADVAQPPDVGAAAYLVAQRRADRGSRAEEIDIDAALAAMPGRLDLIDPTVFLSRPIDLPAFELADALGAALAQESGKILVAKPPAGGKRVSEMPLRIIRLGLAQSGRACHL